MSSPVIIGAGINGLVAAAQLALAGKRPIVLEQLDRPGGAVRTEELTLAGFKHDVAAMNLSLFAGSGFMAAHGDKLERYGFELVPVSHPFTQATSPQDGLGISTDREAMLAQFSEHDRKAWQALEVQFGSHMDLLVGLLNGPMGLRPLASWMWRAWRSLGTNGLVQLIRLLLSSPRTFLNETFEDEKLKTALASWGMHLDFAPDIAGGAIFPYLEGMVGSALGMVIGKGGAGNLTKALVGLIEENGGQILCNRPVSAIRHSSGRVTGVVSGELIATDNVLAGLAPKHLLRLLGSSGKADFDSKMANFEHAPGTMMIHLALDGPAPWLKESFKQYAYVHIGESMDDMAMVYAQAKGGCLPSRPVLVVGQPTLFDPSRAPDGKHILWVQVRMLPAEIKRDAANQITERDWGSVKDIYAERVLDMLEEYAPGLRELTIGRHVVSPLDLEAENPNLVGGDQICGSHALSQNFLFRPAGGYPDGRTPIAGLRLIGAATWPGAGTGAASGYRSALSLK
ncbi:Phytoene desaturase (lycopene-forming) [Pseudovibrio axinellae]|uniref:Pyridine nucleotide-disulfide oxidoreductase domain-containing protein 2 n=1 Tax=Pseudovibrio axinellae TaxID=989403 RepID=A0A161X7R4_9HYPH|nr:NAD(P)/FAD-dependent oxidoreductase [Pseudovibrio axinellae]KZL05043.1 Phytoene desaturase (lycopene-forming) [Pseudovibrio axinellae]SER65756.1 Phytoene dehydrogenase-related protein [Pseudovibrio axinellae]